MSKRAGPPPPSLSSRPSPREGGLAGRGRQGCRNHRIGVLLSCMQSHEPVPWHHRVGADLDNVEGSLGFSNNQETWGAKTRELGDDRQAVYLWSALGCMAHSS